MICKCGCNRFYAHQVVRMDVICDGDGDFYDNIEIATDINLIAEFFKRMKENKYIEEDHGFVCSTFGIKNTCWKYEKEWRILAYNLNPFNIALFHIFTTF
jgi:hypothetical protein